jgi:predicted permease
MAVNPHPPRLARALVSLFLSGDVREVIVGDLDQEFFEAVRAGAPLRAARRRYWRQSMASIAAIRRPLQERMVPDMSRRSGFNALRGLGLDVRAVTRALRHNPGYAGVAILSLAIGIGANTAVFSVMRQIVYDPLPVERPGELRMLYWTPNSDAALDVSQVGSTGYRDPAGVFYRSNFSYPLFGAMQRAVEGAIDLAGYNRVRETTVAADGRPPVIREAMLVTGNFFATVRPPLAFGRALTADDDRPGAPPVAVLSHDLWTQFFDAAPTAVGTIVRVNGTALTVIGVTAREYRGLSPSGFTPAPGVTVPMALQPAVASQWSDSGRSLFSEPRVLWVRAIARVPDGKDSAVTQALQGVLRAELQAAGVPQAIADVSAPRLFPGARGFDSMRNTASQPLRLISVVLGVVLLIACINVAGLMLARGVARQRELDVQRALGASRSRIMRSLLVEGVILSAAGGVAGVLLAVWTAPVLQSLLTSGLGTTGVGFSLDWRLLAVTGALACAAGILSSLLPAIRFSRQSTLRDRTTAGAPRLAIGRALLALQIAVSLPLVAGAGLFLRTLHNLDAVELGFDPDGLILFAVDPTMNGRAPERSAEVYPRLLERLEALPGVTSATVIENPLIANIESDSTVTVNEKKGVMYLNSVGPRYLETMGARLLEGRPLGLGDRRGMTWSVLINETAVRTFFNGQSPVGQRFRISKREVEVVGVVADSKYDGLRNAVPPTALLSFLQREMNGMHVIVRVAGETGRMRRAIEAAVQAVDPGMPLTRYRTQREQIDETTGRERVFARLLTAVGAFALLLACVGLHGVTSYSVTRRTSEIGIRLALGARRSQVLWLVLRQVLVLAAAGLAIGIPMALLAAPAVGSCLLGLRPNDPMTLVVAAAIMVSVAVVAGLLPARRAARLDALAALRAE